MRVRARVCVYVCGVAASDLHFVKITLAAVWGIVEGQGRIRKRNQGES